MYERLSVFLLHPRLREGGTEERFVGRVLVGLFAAALIGALLVNAYFFAIGDLRIAWAHLGFLAIVLTVPIFSRSLGTVRAVQIYVVGLSWAMITVVVLMSGGATSSAIYFYVLIPFFGAALGAWRGGGVGVALAVGTAVVFYVLHWAQVELPTEGVYAFGVDPPSVASATLLVYVISASFIRSRRSVRAEVAAATHSVAAANARADAARAELERAQAAKVVALTRVGCGLHTPLARISLAARRLSDELPGDLHDHAAMVARSAEQLLSKLDAFELYTASWGAGPSVVETFELEQLLEDLRAEYAGDAARKGITLEIRVAAACRGPRRGDPVRLRRVIAELLDNAVKFTAAGVIELTAASGNGDEVVVAVSDTGDGIPEVDRERIFEPLFRGDVTMTRRHGGTGLGLAVARRLACGLGGALSCERGREVGARMVLRLPLAAVPGGEAP